MISSLTDLDPDVMEAAERWLDDVAVRLGPDLAPAVADELRTELYARLDPDATLDQLTDLISEFADIGGEAATRRSRLRGSFLGIPYDLRIPTGRRIRETLWNPASDRVFAPRVFGAGWDVNFGAVAVRLGLIEPDAEDEPFASTPPWAFAVVGALPVALAGAVIAHYAVRGRDLPDRLAAHWNWRGEPDRWVDRRVAATTNISVALLAASTALGANLPPATNATRAGMLGLAAGASTLNALVTVDRDRPAGTRRPTVPLGLGAVFGAVGGTFLALAMAGRSAERRRDLG